MSTTRSKILDQLGSRPTMAKVLSVASQLGRASHNEEDIVRFSIVRNITLEPGLPAALRVQCARNGFDARVQLGGFGPAQNEVFDSASPVYAEEPHIVIVALQLQTLAPRLVLDFVTLGKAQIEDLVESVLKRVVSLVEAIRERSSALILVHNFELPSEPAFGILDAGLEYGQQNVIRRLNIDLARRIVTVGSSYIIDLERLLAAAGYDASVDERYWHIARAPFSFDFLERLAREYVKFAVALKGKSKKCLVLDCDNTLWGGVIGEEGMSGIDLGNSYPGSAYLEFQSAILSLYERGVLLAINSKNNFADVAQVFEEHPSSLLRPHHFVSMKINWNDKVANLREIAADLSIGLESLVFVDDNAFECEFVRERLPSVTVLQLPSDAARYARLLRSSGYFETLAISEEDRRRSEMYRSEGRRSELKASVGSVTEYLTSLCMKLTISTATSFHVPRIAQLTQKTNQFNLTTRRYSEEQVQRMIDDDRWTVLYAELEDKFDKAGIIAVAIIEWVEKRGRIDLLLLSCRVIGRGVEDAIVANIAEQSIGHECPMLIGEYIPSGKNSLAGSFYARVGFTQVSPEGAFWELDLKKTLPKAPLWFQDNSTASLVGL